MENKQKQLRKNIETFIKRKGIPVTYRSTDCDFLKITDKLDYHKIPHYSPSFLDPKLSREEKTTLEEADNIFGAAEVIFSIEKDFSHSRYHRENVEKYSSRIDFFGRMMFKLMQLDKKVCPFRSHYSDKENIEHILNQICVKEDVGNTKHNLYMQPSMRYSTAFGRYFRNKELQSIPHEFKKIIEKIPINLRNVAYKIDEHSLEIYVPKFMFYPD